MKCPACGRENRAAASFCARCGERLTTSDEKEVVATQEQAVEQTQLKNTTEESALVDSSNALEVDTQAPTVELALPPQEEQPAGVEEPATAEPGAEQSPSTPYREGDMLAGRYQIVELVESTPERNRYRARDLRRCAACGYDDNTPEDAYCRQCGASLEKGGLVIIHEHVRHPPEDYADHFEEGEREYYVTVEAGRSEQAPPERRDLRLIFGRATDKGRQRDHNEDYIEAWLYARGSGGLLGLFVVADGLGGQDSGEVASRMATDAVWQALRDSIWEPSVRGELFAPDLVQTRLVQAVQAANEAVYQARMQRHSEMSTTLSMALVIDREVYIGNVGDSRTYVWNADGLVQITKDHSLVQRLVDAGQLQREEVYAHPKRNLIYQSIGDRPRVEVDAFRHRLAPDERLILCSDGLWEMVRDDGLAEVLLSEADPQRACDRLVQNANLAGGEDNISVIIVQAAAT